MCKRVSIVLLFAVCLFAGCQTADQLTPVPVDEGQASISGRKITNDNCGRLGIYVSEIDGRSVPHGPFDSRLTRKHYVPPGRHVVVFELRRDIGWSFAPFHAQVRVEVDVESTESLLPVVELVATENRKEPFTSGTLWLIDSRTGEAVSAKIEFVTEGYPR